MNGLCLLFYKLFGNIEKFSLVLMTSGGWVEVKAYKVDRSFFSREKIKMQFLEKVQSMSLPKSMFLKEMLLFSGQVRFVNLTFSEISKPAEEYRRSMLDRHFKFVCKRIHITEEERVSAICMFEDLKENRLSTYSEENRIIKAFFAVATLWGFSFAFEGE